MSGISAFAQERNNAFFSMDEGAILSFMRKYKIPAPIDKLVFWASIHKCICNITNAPPELRQQSENWLLMHGMSPEIRL